MNTTINLEINGRKISFSMDLEPGSSSDAAISWYMAKGIPPEPEVAHLMARTVQEGDTVIDAGANVGFFSLLLSRYVGNKGRVIAIEPGENNLPKLFANIELNGCKNIEVIARPLTAKGEPVSFYLSSDQGSNACYRDDTMVSSATVASTTLDDIHHWPLPKLLKMDIEGSELEALKGAQALLQVHPPYVVMELNVEALAKIGATPYDIRSFMAQRDYEMFAINEQGTLPARVPRHSKLKITRANTNVLFSAVDDVRVAWPEVAL